MNRLKTGLNRFLQKHCFKISDILLKTGFYRFLLFFFCIFKRQVDDLSDRLRPISFFRISAINRRIHRKTLGTLPNSVFELQA